MNYHLIAVRLLAVALFWMVLWPWPTVAAPRNDRTGSFEVSSFKFSIADNVAATGFVHPGSTITYTLLLTNTGDVPLTNVEIVVLVPRNTTAPAPGATWQCAPPANQPERTICRTAFAVIAVGDARATEFVLELPQNFPPNQQTVLLDANATADGVVCGDCGHAWCETVILQGGGEVEHRVLLPLVVAPDR